MDQSDDRVRALVVAIRGAKSRNEAKAAIRELGDSMSMGDEHGAVVEAIADLLRNSSVLSPQVLQSLAIELTPQWGSYSHSQRATLGPAIAAAVPQTPTGSPFVAIAGLARRSGVPEAINSLEHAARSEDETRRYMAADALAGVLSDGGDVAITRSVRRVLELMLTDNSSDVREVATDALSRKDVVG